MQSVDKKLQFLRDSLHRDASTFHVLGERECPHFYWVRLEAMIQGEKSEDLGYMDVDEQFAREEEERERLDNRLD